MGGIGVGCSVYLPGVVVVGFSVWIIRSIDEPLSGYYSDATCWVSIIPGSLSVDWLGPVRACGLWDVFNGWCFF